MRLRPKGDGTISTVKGQMTEQEMRVRNEVQMAFAQTLDLPGKTRNEKMLAWVTQHALKYEKVWDNNHELRQKVLANWPADRNGCLSALREAWNK